ncbi:transaldolase [Stomatohabitans albus]|uniref:transaldolase n=1 Tax=Stomatohabitans albus TaxID=3110766 RepID=UPI00300C84C0
MTTRSSQIESLGQAIWLDAITRSWLGPDGHIAKLIAAHDIYGLTSNPSIFASAIASAPEYAEAVTSLGSNDAATVLWTLMKEDVGAACDLFAPLYAESNGLHGYCSIEVDPSAAHDAERTISQARELWTTINRPNLMIKVPGTMEGLVAIETLISEGINVNATLLFSVQRYEALVEAWLRGLETRLAKGLPLDRVASVASFFVSRVDGAVDPLLPEGSPLRGKAAIANARSAYAAFERMRSGERWAALKAAGAMVQRPLWASTSAKNPAYSPVLYVDELIGPDTVNTVPEATLDAIRTHSNPADRLSGSGEDARATIQELAEAGIDITKIANDLETAGLSAFVTSFDEAIATVAASLPS